ncbi:hypothetical protein CR513_28546, partial [Mucuna pruriens]
MYKIDLTELTNQNVTCLVSINDNQWMWHKKLDHASLRLVSKLKKHNLVIGLPSLVYKLTRTTSLGGKHYGLVVVDDYSRWT